MNVSDDQKRWLVFGIALNKVLVTQIRSFVEQEVQKEYSSLQTSQNIHTQTSAARLQKWHTPLRYENISGNDTLPRLRGGRYDYSKFDCRVTSHVDLAKLYVENHMAKFNAFDEHCDASAVLTLLGKVPVFPHAVQIAAGRVKQARNAWAHCVFSNWDLLRFQQSFAEMEQLVKALGLPSADEDVLLKELNDWERKGAILCMSATIDPDLVKAVHQNVNALKNDVDKLALEEEEKREPLKKALQDAVTDLEDLEKRVSKVEQEQQVMKMDQDALSAKVNSAQDQINEIKSEQVNVERLVTHLESQRSSTTPQISHEIASCEAEITFFAELHHPDTRKWFFEDFHKWFSDPGDSRAYVLLGDPGVGKSVMAGVLTQRVRKAENLGAAYFCRHNDDTRNNPRYLLGTIACQLGKYNSQYNSVVGGEGGISKLLSNSALGVQELFTKLLLEPLAKCDPCHQRTLVVIDALDETKYESRDDFLDLIMNRFPLLPNWLVFFITSRPEETVQFRLKNYNPCVNICAGNSENLNFYHQHEQDIKLFLEKSVDFCRLPYSVEDIVKKCNGLFLYAFYVARHLKNPVHSGRIDQSSDLFQGDIENFFLQNFKRVFAKVGANLYKKLFGCAIVAPSPLPVSFISFILQREDSELQEQEVIDALSTFLVLRTSDQTFKFIHNLIPAWLTDKGKASRTLFVDRIKAGEYFRDVIVTILSSFVDEQSKGSPLIDANILDYVLRVGVRFLSGFSDKVSVETICSCLTSFKFIQSRIEKKRMEIYSLIEDFKRAAEDQNYIDRKKQFLQEICASLERNVYVLSERPNLLHSCLRITSKAVQDILILDGISATWMEDNCWLPYPVCEIPPDMSCFALSPDKKLLAGGGGQSITFFDACTLEKVQGPIKLVETGNDIHHLEFSSDGKLLFFGRLDKWFSLDKGCFKENLQFAENYRIYKWGSFAFDGRYIVVQGDYPVDGSHTLSCMRNIFCLWATLELQQMQFDEIGYLREFIMRLGVIRPQKPTSRDLKAVWVFFEECCRRYVILDRSYFWHSFGRRTLSELLCPRCLALEQSHQETSLVLIRQRVLRFYHEIFEYQVWNVKSGRSVLEEAFSPGAQLNPFFVMCHLTTALKRYETPFDVINGGASLCGVAIVNAFFYLSLPNLAFIEESRLFNPYFLTHAPTEFRNRCDVENSCVSPDGKWIAVRRNRKVCLFEKSKQSDYFDCENPVHVIKDVKAFAFSDDCSVLLYTTHKSLNALFLETGTTLTSASGFLPLHWTPDKMVGYCFRTGDEERVVFARDLPSSFLEFLWTSLDCTPQLDVSFSSPDTIRSISSRGTLTSWKITDSDRPSVMFVSESCLPDPALSAREVPHCVKNCAFSHDGELLATHQDAKILLFEHNRLVYTVFEEGCDYKVCLTFSNDSTLLLFVVQRCNDTSNFCVWNIQNKVLSVSCDSLYLLLSVDCCCFSSDNIKVIICGELNIQIWEYAEHSCRRVKTLEPIGPCSAFDKFTHCTVSSNSEILACCIGDRILLYPFTSPTQDARQISHGHLGRVEFCQFLKGTRYLISYGVDGTVFLWDLIDWKAVAYVRITQGRESIVSIAVSPEENKVVCVTSLGRFSIIELCGLNCAKSSGLPVRNMNTNEKVTSVESREQLRGRPIPTFQGASTSDNKDISEYDWLLMLSSDESEDSDEEESAE